MTTPPMEPRNSGGTAGRRPRETAEQALLGVGWHFPVRVDLRRSGERSAIDRGRGGIALARYEDDIEQAIRIILMTEPGERRMRPTFGCRVHELVFAPLNATTFGYMERYVEEALALWEPRIEVVSIDIEPTTQAGWVDIAVSYQLRATKDDRTLVYPFYMIGEE
jgi:hypothetical protein